MLNIIWLVLMVASVIISFFTGQTQAVVQAVTDYAKLAFELALTLTGIMAFWLGIMSIAQRSGLVLLFARLMKPVMIRLFPEVPPDHPAMGSMLMNMAANMLGIANAATPFGLKAMEQLKRLNNHSHVASDSMCMFLAINTSSIQLIPTTGIAFLAAAGATHPSSIILTTLLATTCSTLVGITLAKVCARLPWFRFSREEQ